MATDNKGRPNIRVQILNNLTESMEVDEKSENEEGEISDDEMLKTAPNKISIDPPATNRVRPNMNPKNTFTTGINIFDKEEQEKLHERAKRFALKPEDIKTFSDDDLDQLHDSLGISEENEGNVRFDAIHLFGTNEMSTEDVFDYFQSYAPTAIEWVNDGSCNVLWTENISTARAMHYSSREVMGMPARGPSDPFAKEFLDDVPDEETGQSILLKNAHREIELSHDLPIKTHSKNAAQISDITVPIPPGYWRLGTPHPKAKCLLLRFALKTDKKPYQVEKFSSHKKYGNPNFSEYKGIISESKKKEFRSIFERNKEMNDKNPWGSLARNWNQDMKYCEREPVIEEEPKVEIKNPALLGRLGTKESVAEPVEEEIEEDEPPAAKKSKVPRMRMYADEEEEKQKRKKLLQTIKNQAKKLNEPDPLDQSDLRNVLGITNQKSLITGRMYSDKVDLGAKLRNRNQKMLFTLEREEDEVENVPRKDVRALLDERRARSPHLKRSAHRNSPDRSPYRKKRKDNYSRRHKRSSEERTLHSDRVNQYDDESDDEYSTKPKSKVAVVIKTQKKPAVASKIWPKVNRRSDSSNTSHDSQSESEEKSSESEGEVTEAPKESGRSILHRIERPGFESSVKSRLSERLDHKSPLKIEISNK